MKCRLVSTAVAAGLVDPVTKRTPFYDAETKAAIAEADVPETNFWVRRVIDRDIARVEDTKPTGREPITPLSTR